MCLADPKSAACDFEDGACGYTSDGDPFYIDWIRTNGSNDLNIIGNNYLIYLKHWKESVSLVRILKNELFMSEEGLFITEKSNHLGAWSVFWLGVKA